MRPSAAKGWSSCGVAMLALATSTAFNVEPTAAPEPRWRSYYAAFEPGDGSASDRSSSAFVPGHKGRALRAGRGGGLPEFAQRGVVDLSRPGAITCWIRPIDWRGPDPGSDYVPIIRVIGSGSAAVVVERDRRAPGRTFDVWIAGYFSLASHGEVQMQRELPSMWSQDAWHFIAFQWDSTGFSLQLDDSAPARMALPGVAIASEFPKATSTLVIGGGGPDAFLVDELSVWSRPLESHELTALRSN